MRNNFHPLKCPFVLTACFGIYSHSTFDHCNIFAKGHFFLTSLHLHLAFASDANCLHLKLTKKDALVKSKGQSLGYFSPAIAAGFSG